MVRHSPTERLVQVSGQAAIKSLCHAGLEVFPERETHITETVVTPYGHAQVKMANVTVGTVLITGEKGTKVA